MPDIHQLCYSFKWLICGMINSLHLFAFYFIAFCTTFVSFLLFYLGFFLAALLITFWGNIYMTEFSPFLLFKYNSFKTTNFILITCLEASYKSWHIYWYVYYYTIKMFSVTHWEFLIFLLIAASNFPNLQYWGDF